MSLNPVALWRAWRNRRALKAERRLVWSAVTLPAGTYTRSPDGTWQRTDRPDPARASVTVTRNEPTTPSRPSDAPL